MLSWIIKIAVKFNLRPSGLSGGNAHLAWRTTIYIPNAKASNLIRQVISLKLGLR